jgi:imidazolonepropionase-like amidohydrolase
MSISQMIRAAAALSAVFAVASRPSPATAQLGSFNPVPGPHAVYAIRNAKIVTVSGPTIERGTVVIGRDGKIQAVGVDAAIPAGAQTLDGSGLIVYPGMMDASTTMGLSEIGQGAASTVDVSEVGSFNPNASAFYGINPHSAHVGVTRIVGITHVISHPTGGIISGQAALLNLAGDTPPQMAVSPQAALTVTLPRSGFAGRGFGRGGGAQLQGGTADVNRIRQAQLDSLRQLLRDADAYGKAQDAYARDKSLPRPARDVVLAALLPALRGQMPVVFNADGASDIRDAVNFAEEMKLKPIIVGGGESVKVAAFLKQHNVPVIVTHVLALPSREDDPYDINYSIPAKLAAAGVKFAVAVDGGAEARDLPYVAGMAAAFGLPKEEAVKAVTLYPAQIFGVADRFGSIEVGKTANLVMTTGDLLEARTDTKALFIDGRPIPLSTKHTYMFEMFKDRP